MIELKPQPLLEKAVEPETDPFGGWAPEEENDHTVVTSGRP
jgi:hypothetical protein